jgi:hypothetical protein
MTGENNDARAVRRMDVSRAPSTTKTPPLSNAHGSLSDTCGVPNPNALKPVNPEVFAF